MLLLVKTAFREANPGLSLFRTAGSGRGESGRQYGMHGDRGLARRERPEAQSMKRTRPMRGDRREMGFRGIAKMLAETIGRIYSAEAAHQTVARHLGDDGGGGDR